MLNSLKSHSKEINILLNKISHINLR